MKIAGYETHPAADLFPLLEGEDLQKLADDIKANGLREPIITCSGKILDGRNRLRACEMAGVKPRFQGWIPPPGQSPITYVVSLNLRRRHLDASQRAMIGEALMPMYEAEAKERQGTRTDLRANLPEGSAGRAREKVAEVVNVSPRLVADAIVVKREAKPEVVKAVQDGTVSVSAAAKETREAKAYGRALRRRRRPANASGSSLRIPASIPKNARVSIPEFSVFLSSRFTSTDKARLGRLLLGEDGDAGPPSFHLLVASDEFLDALRPAVRKAVKRWPANRRAHVAVLLRTLADELEVEYEHAADTTGAA